MWIYLQVQSLKNEDIFYRFFGKKSRSGKDMKK